MNIIHIIDYFQPKVGYQETFLAKEHVRMGHKVTVVTSDRYYPFPDYFNSYQALLGDRIIRPGRYTECGIDTWRLESLEMPGTPLVYLKNLHGAIKHLKPDVVLCHGAHSLTSYRIARYKGEMRFRLIYDTHAAHFNTNLTNTTPKKMFHFIYQKVALPVISSRLDAVFAIGEDEQALICEDFQLNPHDVPIIRLGVDTQLFSFNGAERKKIRKNLGIQDIDVVIIYTGKLTINKDLDILIGAINMLNSKNIKAIIIGNGEGSYVKYLKNKVRTSSSIKWLNMVNNSLLGAYYSAADIAIWPGNSTIAILEAAACRLPIILPVWYGTEYLDESKGVLRYPRGNVKDLAGKIAYLAYHKALRRKMGAYSEQYARKKLSWSIIARQTLDLAKT